MVEKVLKKWERPQEGWESPWEGHREAGAEHPHSDPSKSWMQPWMHQDPSMIPPGWDVPGPPLEQNFREAEVGAPGDPAPSQSCREVSLRKPPEQEDRDPGISPSSPSSDSRISQWLPELLESLPELGALPRLGQQWDPGKSCSHSSSCGLESVGLGGRRSMGLGGPENSPWEFPSVHGRLCAPGCASSVLSPCPVLVSRPVCGAPAPSVSQLPEPFPVDFSLSFSAKR